MKGTESTSSAQVLKKTQPEEFDLVILGGGMGSTIAAWTFAGEGKQVAVVERKYIGGSCPNTSRACRARTSSTARRSHTPVSANCCRRAASVLTTARKLTESWMLRRLLWGSILKNVAQLKVDERFALLAPIDNHQLTFWRTLLRISSDSCSFCTARASTTPSINAADWKMASFRSPPLAARISSNPRSNAALSSGVDRATS